MYYFFLDDEYAVEATPEEAPESTNIGTLAIAFVATIGFCMVTLDLVFIKVHLGLSSYGSVAEKTSIRIR